MHLPLILRNLHGEPTFLRPGDEIVEPGLPVHKRVFVGIMGPQGENVLDPAKGQRAQLVHLQFIPNWQNLRVGVRGPENLWGQRQVQTRAREVLSRGVVNHTIGPNCEHISSYIRDGKPESPQLRFWVGIAAVMIVGLALANAQ